MKKFLVFLAATSLAAGALASNVSNTSNDNKVASNVEAESIKSSVVVSSALAKVKGSEVHVTFSVSSKQDLNVKGVVCEAANRVVPPKTTVITADPKEFVVVLSDFKKGLPRDGESVTLVLQLDSGETVEVKAVVSSK